MNRQDIIRMAREAGWTGPEENVTYVAMLERFANLVAAAEREKWQWDDIHSCHPHCDRPACVAVRRAKEDEREMCAELCEALRLFHCDDIGYSELPYKECAFAIRERGAP